MERRKTSTKIKAPRLIVDFFFVISLHRKHTDIADVLIFELIDPTNPICYAMCINHRWYRAKINSRPDKRRELFAAAFSFLRAQPFDHFKTICCLCSAGYSVDLPPAMDNIEPNSFLFWIAAIETIAAPNRMQKPRGKNWWTEAKWTE